MNTTIDYLPLAKPLNRSSSYNQKNHSIIFGFGDKFPSVDRNFVGLRT
jgi:hypothetical protein